MTELALTNIALRAINEPPVAALSDSPLATETRDRALEISKRLQQQGPWSFARATYRLPIGGAGSNIIPWQAGESVIETTSLAELTLCGVDQGYAWLRLDTGTAVGAKLLTGQKSGAIRLGGALPAALAIDDVWAIADLPEPFAHWLAKETGLDMERQYKMGTMEESVLRAEVLRTRAEFKEWDAQWGVANIFDMDSVAVPRMGFTTSREVEDDDDDE
jgi:hypothetical protein